MEQNDEVKVEEEKKEITVVEEQERNNLGIVSLVTGIISLFVFGVILGIIAIVTSIMAQPKDGKSTAGLVMGIIGLIGALLI